MFCLLTLYLMAAFPGSAVAQVLFEDAFEDDLDGWVLHEAGGVFLGPSGDPTHGQVLILRPQGDVYALVKGSESWGGVRMEGEVLFPDAQHNYLGFIYAFREEGRRSDFGLIYIKGNGSYLRVNPHRDFNVGRTLYEEYRTPLENEAAIEIGEWQRFKVEVIGSEAHVYVGEMDKPQLTFSDFELNSGAVGLHPRSVGGDVWVDDFSISTIQEFTYAGPPIPELDYQPDSLLTEWKVAGPLPRTEGHRAHRGDAPDDRAADRARLRLSDRQR